MLKSEKPYQLYNASAGSGKTYNLVKNFIKLIFQNTKEDFFKNILAVTFTNKAANEMKSRLIETLYKMSGADFAENQMLQQISEELQLSPEEVNQLAKSRLKYILHNYSLLSFYTLDKFTLRLLKNFSKELNLSYNFSVEIEPYDYYEEAFYQFKDDFDAQSPLYQSVLNYYLNVLDEEQSLYMVDKNTIGTMIGFDSENNLPFVKANQELDASDISKLKNDIWKEQRDIPSKIQNLAQNSVDLMNANGLEIGDFKGASSYGLKKFLESIVENGVSKSDVFDKEEKFEEEKWYAKSNDAKADTIRAIIPQLLDDYHEMQKCYAKYLLNQNVLYQLFPLQISKKVQENIKELKQEDDRIFINEFKPIVSEHLQNQPSAFIFEKLGNRYQHIFFDEFQDTSEMEWQNFQPLVENITSQGPEHSVSIIGDPKQSIYRFKGGKPEIMLDIIEKALQPNQEMYDNNRLTTNYRSAENIVDFNNDLYDFLSRDLPNESYQDLFGKLGKQYAKPDAKGGYVQFTVFNNEDYQAQEYQKILDIINDAKNRNIHLCEVAILVQRNKDAQMLSQYLLDAEPDLEIATEESLLLYKNDGVDAMISLLRCIQNPSNNGLFFKFLYSLSLSSDYLKDSFENVALELIDKNENAFDNFKNKYGIDFLKIHSQSTDLYNLVETLIRELSFKPNQQNYLMHLLDVVYELENQKTIDIENFLDYWNDKGESIKITASVNPNAVNIMTIHKAKGLEFKVVILPNMKDSSKDSLWIPVDELYHGLSFSNIGLNVAEKIQKLNPKIAEAVAEKMEQVQVDEICRYYVATTRPEEELYILLNYNNENKFSQYLVANGKMPAPDSGNKKDFETLEIELYPDEKLKTYPKPENQNHTDNVVNFSSFSWKDRLKITQEVNKIFTSEAIEKGNQLHDLMAVVKAADDVEKVIQLALMDDFIEDENAEKLQQQMEAIVNHPNLKDYYSTDYDILNERDILYDGQLYRPDRLMKKGQEISIIDYKTGAEQSKDKAQILQYQSVMKNLGYTVKNCILVYTNDEGIHCVAV